MSMIDPAPSLTLPKYSDAWWQEWRESYACAQYNFRQSNSRSDKRVLRHLHVSAGIGMAHYFASEVFEATREQLAHFRGDAGRTLKRAADRVLSVFRRKA